MAGLSLQGISKGFGITPVLGCIDLEIRDGEFLALVGPSGCGKSTLLRIIAGLERQDTGSVSIGGLAVDHLRPHQRKVAMVFQNYALYPHMTVLQNMALPLTMSRLNVLERLPLVGLLSSRRRAVMKQIEADVQAVAEQLQIRPFGTRRPGQLSGGQRQRVALGRAMVRDPDVFLMDEPLSNLDAKLRVHMRAELADLHDRLGVTMVYVTHDQIEAMTMANRLAVMDQGAILQLGTPTEVYERPASVVVAQFIGSPGINLLPARVAHAGAIDLLGDRHDMPLGLDTDACITVGVRPEAIRLTAQPGDWQIPCRFKRRENLGSESILHFELCEAPATMVLCKIANEEANAWAGQAGERATLAVLPSSCHFFNDQGWRVEPLTAHAESGKRSDRAQAIEGIAA